MSKRAQPSTASGAMVITLQYFEGCPNWETTAADLTRIIEDLQLDATVEFLLIDSHKMAVDYGFMGSPTVLVGGVDPFAMPDSLPGLSCRLYRVGNATAGTPSVAQLTSAIKSGSERRKIEI